MKIMDISWKKYLFPTIHQEGWRFVGMFAAISALLGVLYKPFGWVGAILTIWCYYFFRDPVRVTPDNDDLVISPADGTVQMITKCPLPEELELKGANKTKEVTRVSVFMSVFNVHVNRMPATGKITKSVYVPGKFVNATLDKASKDNERQILLMETKADKKPLAFVQIAGLVARRILCEVTEGQELKRGERFGLIRFGSRLDIYLPAGVEPQVYVGQTMIAGESVIASLSNNPEELETIVS